MQFVLGSLDISSAFDSKITFTRYVDAKPLLSFVTYEGDDVVRVSPAAEAATFNALVRGRLQVGRRPVGDTGVRDMDWRATVHS